MVTDAIREALSVTRDAYQAADDELPLGDPDLKAAALSGLDNACLELEEVLDLVAIPADETS